MPGKVKHYIVLTVTTGIANPAPLEAEVVQHISNGWEPQGGVSLTRYELLSDKGYVWAQAMIKTEDEE